MLPGCLVTLHSQDVMMVHGNPQDEPSSILRETDKSGVYISSANDFYVDEDGNVGSLVPRTDGADDHHMKNKNSSTENPQEADLDMFETDTKSKIIEKYTSQINDVINRVETAKAKHQEETAGWLPEECEGEAGHKSWTVDNLDFSVADLINEIDSVRDALGTR